MNIASQNSVFELSLRVGITLNVVARVEVPDQLRSTYGKF